MLFLKFENNSFRDSAVDKFCAAKLSYKGKVIWIKPAAEVGEELLGRVLRLALKAPEGGRCFGGLGVPGNGQIHPQVRCSLAPLSRVRRFQAGGRVEKKQKQKQQKPLSKRLVLAASPSGPSARGAPGLGPNIRFPGSIGPFLPFSTS